MSSSQCTTKIVLALLATVFFKTPALTADNLVLNFGVYTSDKPSEMYKQFRPILKYLENTASRNLNNRTKIKLRIFKSYEGATRALVDGTIDFVRFGPASYILANERNPGVTILAAEMNKSKRTFQGVIFVHADSPLNTLADLKGKSFAFGNEFSTIGRYLSQAELVRAGIFAGELEKYEYLDRHDRVATAVLHGKFDAGAAKESTFKQYGKKGLRALKTFDNITKPWVARAELKAEVVEALRAGLGTLSDKRVLGTLGKKLTGFDTDVNDSTYDFVRRGMKKSEEFFDTTTNSPAPKDGRKVADKPSRSD
jgi:phosphonate transport system substrate-binding protein